MNWLSNRIDVRLLVGFRLSLRLLGTMDLGLPCANAEVSAQLISLNSDKKLDDKINFTEDRGQLMSGVGCCTLMVMKFLKMWILRSKGWSLTSEANNSMYGRHIMIHLRYVILINYV